MSGYAKKEVLELVSRINVHIMGIKGYSHLVFPFVCATCKSTTNFPHARDVCRRCYSLWRYHFKLKNDPAFKERQKNNVALWHKNNPEKSKAAQKKYQEMKKKMYEKTAPKTTPHKGA